MKRWMAAALVAPGAVLARMTGAPAAAQPVDSGVGRYVVVPNPDVLVGHYRLEEEEFSIDIRLNADRTATYLVRMDRRGRGMLAEGIWDYRHDRIHIHNTPPNAGSERPSWPVIAAGEPGDRKVQPEVARSGMERTRRRRADMVPT